MPPVRQAVKQRLEFLWSHDFDSVQTNTAVSSVELRTAFLIAARFLVHVCGLTVYRLRSVARGAKRLVRVI
jgi:hypothetical protein